ncbi:TRAP transporter small permease [Ammoniphilus sp. 3BR4]|uniref:TRAP transporter small permease n=1 Tax=Ammoniphilus sp. 3BR4 TaxID=3158265 RepID=UPI003466DA94
MSKFLEKIEFAILALSLAIMSTVTFVNVISRYFLTSSLAFTEELTVNLFVLLTFVGASVAISRKGHLGFNLLFDSIQTNGKVILTLFIGLISTLLFLVLFYFGIDMILFQKQLGQISPALGWPQWVFSLGLPIGSAFCLIRAIEVTSLEVKTLLAERGRQA